MRRTTKTASSWAFFAILIVLAAGFSVSPTPAQAQGTGAKGQNAVYPPSGTCCIGTPAFIDASQFSAQTLDFCQVLNNILSGPTYPTVGAVIDARGLPGITGTSMKCGASPWANIQSPPPSTILLPAGTILIPGPWVLPTNTKIIGEGENMPSGAAPGTTIQACVPANGCSFNGSAMIQFGTNTGMSVERLTLDGAKAPKLLI